MSNLRKLCLGIVAFCSTHITAMPQEQKSTNIFIRPLTVSVAQVGSFTEGYSWYLSMNSDGDAVLVVNAYPKLIKDTFTVSEEELDKLRSEVRAQKFFDLKNEYGENIAEGTLTVITIAMGEKVNTVKLRELMNWTIDSPERLQEPSRALRILGIVRNWVKHPEAVDLRKFEEIVIKKDMLYRQAK